jgi:histidinol-phosphate aminotransferase
LVEITATVRRGISGIEPYVPGMTDDEIKKRYGLRQIVKLNANENALGASPKALSAIQHELSNLHLYPDGSSEWLKRAIAEYHQVDAKQVMVGNGSDELITLLAQTFLEEGDEVVAPYPTFSQYGFGTALMRATMRYVPFQSDFTYDVEQLLAAVTPKTKLLYLCSPNNPTGVTMEQAAFDWLLSRLPESVMVIVDAAYNDYSRSLTRLQETPKLLNNPRVCFLHTFSKLYGLAGLRIGYGLGEATLWEYVNRVRQPFNVNRIAQRAGAAALSDEAHRVASRNLVAESYPLYASLTESGFEVIPGEGNFVLVRTGDGRETVRQLMGQGIVVRTGFPSVEAYVRITYGLPQENEQCVEALKRFGTIRR